MYLSRSLSFVGAEFETIECNHTDFERGPVSFKSEAVYDAAAAFWQLTYKTLMWGIESGAIRYPSRDDDDGDGDDQQEQGCSPALRVYEGEDPLFVAKRYYWAANLRFFRSLCVALKVQTAVSLSEIALTDGKAVVIGLQSTGEAASKASRNRLSECPEDELVVSPLMVLENLIPKLFPIPPARVAPRVASPQQKEEKPPCPKQSPGAASRLYREKELELRPANSPIIIDLVSDSDGDDYDEEKEPELIICSDSEDDERPCCCQSVAEIKCDLALDLTDPQPPVTRQSPPSPAPPSEDGDGDGLDEGHDLLRLQLIEKVNVLKRLLTELVLPGHPLDELIDKLGGEDEVAEMTGRKNRYVRCAETGKLVYCSRLRAGDGSSENVNYREREAFQTGAKHVAIISDACSSGISLHADLRVVNQRRRYHITIELAWAADKAIQQLGRSHRSNQASAPQYQLLITPYGGERRFASTVAKKLESLGALTQGDRRANMSSFSDFHFDSQEGSDAIKDLFESIRTLRPDSDFPPLDPEERLRTLELLQSLPECLAMIQKKKSVESVVGLFKAGVAGSGVLAAAVWLWSVGLESLHDPLNGARKKSFPLKIFLNRLLSLEGNRQDILFRVTSPPSPLALLTAARSSKPNSRLSRKQRSSRGDSTKACWSWWTPANFLVLSRRRSSTRTQPTTPRSPSASSKSIEASLGNKSKR
jgi:hypothetical protein